MNATNTSALGLNRIVMPAPSPMAANNAAPSASIPAAVSAVNKRTSRIFPSKPLVNCNGATKEPSAPAQPLDPALEQNDVKIVITVDVHGRKSQFANLQMDRTVFEGLQDQNRWVFHQTLENMLEEIQQAVGFKLNYKLDSGRKHDPKNGYANGDYREKEHAKSDSAAQAPNGNGGKPHLGTEKLPLADEEMSAELEDMLRIHVPPPLDAH